MKSFIFVLLMATNVFANSQAIFTGVSSEVRIFIQSSSAADPDARRFFEMVDVPPTIVGTNEKKSAQFTSSDGVVTDLLCSLSTRIANLGSCQMVVRPSAVTKIDKANKFIDIQLLGEDAQKFLAVMKIPAVPNPVFISADGHFSIFALNNTSTASEIRIQYQE